MTAVKLLKIKLEKVRAQRGLRTTKKNGNQTQARTSVFPEEKANNHIHHRTLARKQTARKALQEIRSC